MAKDKVQISLSKEEWEKYSYSLSDVLCWARGFEAGLPEEKQHCKPYGIKELIDLNLIIKNNI